MSDPQHPIIEEFVKPSDAELKARTNRNRAIAFALLGFVVFVFLLMLFKLGYFG